MSKILVSGLINMETTVSVKEFPVPYEPINYSFFGIKSYPSGVGLNLSAALHQLGDDVTLLSLAGQDANWASIENEIKKEGISTEYIDCSMEESASSVILYDEAGKRKIYCDLKDIQDRTYNEEKFEQAVEDSDLVCLCNINFNRKLLKKAKEMNKIIATDVQVLSDLNDEYNKDFMEYANILFFSDELIPGDVKEFILQVADTYDNDIIVVGCGKEGAYLYIKKDHYLGKFPAAYTRKIVNTVGAGDALFSAFNHFYIENGNAYEAIKKAMVFASYKIGENGGAKGFLTEEKLNELYEKNKEQMNETK